MVEFLACIGTNIWQEVIGSDFQEIAFEGGEGAVAVPARSAPLAGSARTRSKPSTPSRLLTACASCETTSGGPAVRGLADEHRENRIMEQPVAVIARGIGRPTEGQAGLLECPSMRRH